MPKTITVKKQGEKDALFKQDVLNESIITVGNNPNATLELNDATIAPEQFVIISEEGQILLMNRADGTIVNGKTLGLGGKIELREGDLIEIGEFELAFSTLGTNGSAPMNTVEIENTPIPSPNELLPSETEKDFSAVLNNLREEDSFYFHLVDKENVIERVLFDSEDIWIGTSFAESAIKKDKTELDEIYAHVKKDWSGAVIYPEESEEVFLNGSLLTEPSRLKNDDELVLADDFAEDDETPTKISFHEPVVLLALNSILPEDLPEPVSHHSDQSTLTLPAQENMSDPNRLTDGNEKSSVARKRTKRRIFGYFSLLEVMIMAVGTFVTAAIVFLVLEFV